MPRPCLQGARAVYHSQDFVLRAAALASKIKFNKCVSPPGELLKLKQEHRAVYPQQPTRASMDSENMHLTFDESIASSVESTSVQTPWQQRSKVNNTEDRLQPAGMSAACSWSRWRRSITARSNIRGQEGRQELCFPAAAPFGLISPYPCQPGTWSFWIITQFKGIRNNPGRERHRNSQVCIYSNFVAPLCLCR